MKRIKTILIIIIVLTLCACGIISYKDITQNYLNDTYKEYNDTFTYINCLYDLFPGSNERCYYKSEKYGDEITVKVSKEGNSVKDNYYHIIYDKEIARIYQNAFPDDYKVFVSSQSNYNNKKYDNLYEYMNDISHYVIFIYTTNKGYNKNNIKEMLNKKIKYIGIDNYISITVYNISEEEFENIKEKPNDANRKEFFSLNFKDGEFSE